MKNERDFFESLKKIGALSKKDIWKINIKPCLDEMIGVLADETNGIDLRLSAIYSLRLAFEKTKSVGLERELMPYDDQVLDIYKATQNRYIQDIIFTFLLPKPK